MKIVDTYKYLLNAFPTSKFDLKSWEKYLFNTKSVSAALIAGAFLMLYAERHRGKNLTENVSDLKVSQALFIGFFKCLAEIF